ncbi:MAG: cyclic nucleotide-binding domain-containing protein [Pseudomonadota bacterium]
MTDTSIQELQQMPVFGGLSASTLGTLLSHAEVVPCAPGNAYFRQGEEGDSLFVLLHGRAAAVLQTAKLSYTLRPIDVGDSFGEAAAIDLQPRSNTVVAHEPCLAMEIGPDVMQRVWQQDLEQITLLHMNIGRELSRRLRDSDNYRLEHWHALRCPQ